MTTHKEDTMTSPAATKRPYRRLSVRTDEGIVYLREVATIHREARLRGEHPVAAVAAAYGAPVTTANNWVHMARNAGLIPARVWRRG
jgi:hypothetical protein